MGNTSPIYTRVADIQWANSAVTSNTTIDMTTGTTYQCFTADTTNGGYVQRMRFKPLGTNVATVARIWLNNGNPTSAATNNILWDEYSLGATTVSQTAAQSVFELPLNFAMPPSYRLYATLGTGVAAGYDIITIGGKY